VHENFRRAVVQKAEDCETRRPFLMSHHLLQS
jgi:hypothetical protein